MAEFKERIDALASLMEEYRLTEAALEDGPFRVAFRRHATPVVASSATVPTIEEAEEPAAPEPPAPAAPLGTPVTTPMGGIFYDAPSPTSPPFVKEGDAITVGQIVGLIEAMKVFNEIPSPVGGVVRRLVAEAGSIVTVGDTLILVG